MGQKSDLRKSGGTYSKSNDVLYKIEQFTDAYLINFSILYNITKPKVYKFKSEFEYCLFTGYTEVYGTTFFALFKCKDFSIIIVQKNWNKPITFKSRENYHFIATIIEERFLLISLSNKFKGLWLSNAAILSLNSLEEFEMLDYYTMENLETVLQFLYYLNLEIIEFDFYFDENLSSNTSEIIRINYTNYGNFSVDSCRFNGPFYNPKNISVFESNWKAQKRTDIVSYHILSFKEEDSGSFMFDNDKFGLELINIPNTVKIDSPQTYTFIVEEDYLKNKRKRINSIEILQWVDYWMEWYNSILCKTCKFEENGELKTNKWLGAYLRNLFYINVAVCSIVSLIFIWALIKSIPFYTYIHLWNHYQSIIAILLLSFVNYNSYSSALILSTLILPYISFFNLYSLQFQGYNSIIPQYNDMLIDFIIKESSIPIYVFLSCFSIMILIHIIIIIVTMGYFDYSAENNKLKNTLITYQSFFHYVIFPSAIFAICYFVIVKYISGEINISALYFLLLLFIIIILLFATFFYNKFDLMSKIEIYTRKIFNYEIKNIEVYTWYFEGLKNESDCLLFNILHNIKRFILLPIFIVFICFKISIDSRSLTSYFFYWFLLLWVFVLETAWLYYLVRVYPYKSLSVNRILVSNQIIVLLFWWWGIATYIEAIFKNEINNDLLFIIDYIRAILILPLSYLLFFIHFCIVKIWYVKKRNIILPRFWDPKNPNRFFGRKNSFTEYMPIDPYKRDLQ